MKAASLCITLCICMAAVSHGRPAPQITNLLQTSEEAALLARLASINTNVSNADYDGLLKKLESLQDEAATLEARFAEDLGAGIKDDKSVGQDAELASLLAQLNSASRNTEGKMVETEVKKVAEKVAVKKGDSTLTSLVSQLTGAPRPSKEEKKVDKEIRSADGSILVNVPAAVRAAYEAGNLPAEVSAAFGLPATFSAVPIKGQSINEEALLSQLATAKAVEEDLDEKQTIKALAEDLDLNPQREAILARFAAIKAARTAIAASNSANSETDLTEEIVAKQLLAIRAAKAASLAMKVSAARASKSGPITNLESVAASLTTKRISLIKILIKLSGLSFMDGISKSSTNVVYKPRPILAGQGSLDLSAVPALLESAIDGTEEAKVVSAITRLTPDAVKTLGGLMLIEELGKEEDLQEVGGLLGLSRNIQDIRWALFHIKSISKDAVKGLLTTKQTKNKDFEAVLQEASEATLKNLVDILIGRE